MPQPTKKPEYFSNANGVPINLEIKRFQDIYEYHISFDGADANISKYFILLSAVAVNVIAVIYVQISIHIIITILSTFAFLVLLWLVHSVQSEKVVLKPGECIQSTVKYVFGKELNSIKWSTILDIVINEVIQQQRVIYYLTVIAKVDDVRVLIPLFTNTKPRLDALQLIYSDFKNILIKASKQRTVGSQGDHNG